MSLAFLYAGQGSQHPGMGADLYEAHPAFRAVLDTAGVDFDLKTTMFTDPDGVLNLTEYTQPCMVAFAAGMTALLAERGIVPDYAAGLSLGEYSALQCAGVFTAPQAISLAAFRGKAMAAAAAGRPCGMTAVLGLDREKLQEACRQAAGAGWWRSPTTTAPASWSSAASRPPWTRPPHWPRSWKPSAACP